jgi:non-ribosomal peptide synthetase component F
VHKGSFILWFCAMAVHVLAYVPRLPRLLSAEARGVALPGDDTGGYPARGRHASRAAQILGGRGTRLALLIASLLAGLVIALLTVHQAGQWELFRSTFSH